MHPLVILARNAQKTNVFALAWTNTIERLIVFRTHTVADQYLGSFLNPRTAPHSARDRLFAIFE